MPTIPVTLPGRVLLAAPHHRVFPELQADFRYITTLCQHRRSHRHLKTCRKHATKVAYAGRGRFPLALLLPMLPRLGLQRQIGSDGGEAYPVRRDSRHRGVLWVYMAGQRTSMTRCCLRNRREP